MVQEKKLLLKVRQGLIHHFLVPALHAAKTRELVAFFGRVIGAVLTNLVGRHVLGSETVRKDALVAKTCSLKMLACVYARAPKSQVHAPSEITSNGVGYLKEIGLSEDKGTGREMSQFLVKHLKETRAQVRTRHREGRGR